MGVHTTVVFTDLHGSTAVFEALGNALATETVTQITTWVGQQCVLSGGRLVKTLGDGVLAMFPDGQSAINAVVEIQRAHSKRITRSPIALRMPMRIGVASGDVEIVAGDCYGDAVNVASRLCDLCGPYQIWANEAAVNAILRHNLAGVLNSSTCLQHGYDHDLVSSPSEVVRPAIEQTARRTPTPAAMRRIPGGLHNILGFDC